MEFSWARASRAVKKSGYMSSDFKQCCGSGMFIPDPGSWFLPIPDPGSRISDPGSKNSNKREGWKKICCHTFLCSHKFPKIEHYFSFEVLTKKIWANFQRIIELFTQKIVTKLSKYGFGIRDPEKTYSGSRIQGSKRHRVPDPDQQNWFKLISSAFLVPIITTSLYGRNRSASDLQKPMLAIMKFNQLQKVFRKSLISSEISGDWAKN